MKNCFFSCLLFLLPVASFAQDWKTFTDSAGFFTAQYPHNWTNKIKQGNRVFFTSPASSPADKFLENINISAKAGYTTEVKLTDLLPLVVTSLKNEFDDFKEESTRHFKWNDTDAAELIYSGRSKQDNTMKIRSIQWYCFYQSRLYVVTFVAAEGNNLHNKTASKIMASIVFK